MSKSHHSLRTLYECSHPNLDQIVDISNEFGVGARLTGAGWGGCVVALTDSITTCDRYITTLKKLYYDRITHSKHLNLDEVVFATVSWTFIALVTRHRVYRKFSPAHRSRRMEQKSSSQNSLKLCAMLF